MHVLREYTLDYIKHNKKTSLIIMLGIFMASILINSICLYVYNSNQNKIDRLIKKKGNWHAEFFDTTYGKDLSFIKAYNNVEVVMVKGSNYVAQLNEPQDENRPYLLLRDYNKQYWQSMDEQYSITEGRMPTNTREIVVSKQFMRDYEGYQIGDSLSLPIGQRSYQGEVIDAEGTKVEGESFKQTGEATFTIVGVLDMTIPSSRPVYIGFGYLEDDAILPEDEIVVYLRLKNMRTTYEDLPKIAEQIGFEKNEFGEYDIKYNNQLLGLNYVFPKGQVLQSVHYIADKLIYAAIILVLMSLFVFIIYNNFEISMQNRIKQLGMFKSIGATPKQITSAITFEGLMLSLIPIPLGILISCGIVYAFIAKSNQVYLSVDMETERFHFSLAIETVAILLTLITVWLASYLPSLKMRSKMPIEILRGTIKKQPKVKNLPHRFKNRPHREDVHQELACSNFRVYKKSFRVASLSIMLSILALMACLTAIGSRNLSNDIYYKELQYNLELNTYDGKPIDEAVTTFIESESNINTVTQISMISGTIWIDGAHESEAFSSLGGLEKRVNEGQMVKRDNLYRMTSTLIGVDDTSFKAYCEQIGTDYQSYYDTNQMRAIVYNQGYDVTHSTPRYPVYISLFDFKEGEKLTWYEKQDDDDEGDYEIAIEVGKVTDEFPEGLEKHNESVIQIMPMSVYQDIVGHLDISRIPKAMRISLRMNVAKEDTARVHLELKALCDEIYGEENYYLWDQEEDKVESEKLNQTTVLFTVFVTAFFAIIGISNAYSTIYMSLQQRSRMFAILQSVGVTPKGIRRILVKEVVYFISRPILYATLGEVALVGLTIYMQESTLKEFLPYLPIGTFILFMLMMCVVISLAYYIGSEKIRKQNIAEILKDETV